LTALTIAQRQQKLRNIILDVLLHKSSATAREISYELQVHDVWKSPREITGLINGDPQLKRRVDVEYRNYRGWGRLTFSLKRTYNSMIGYKEKGGEKHKHI